MARQYLIEFREKANESQQDVADAVGISRQYYSFIEAGLRQKRMDVTLAVKLAHHFSVDVGEIIKHEDALAN